MDGPATADDAAALAHDFGNMLHVISGYVDCAVGLAATPAQKQMLSRAQEGCRKAKVLIDQTLLNSGSLALNTTKVSLNTLVKRLHAFAGPTFGLNDGIDLQLDPEAGEVCVDVGRTEDAVLNVMRNAIDAMGDGGRLTLSTAADGEFVLLSIKDDGPGMSEDVKARALTPFFTTKANGTGLGLALVDRFMRLSGGDLAIDSAEGEGTSVRLRFPRAEHAALQEYA